jgi:FSR family fosmidomycin resistance protein-like MFS transporter
MTIFFVVSCAVQALSGFVVDRFGPRPILFGGLTLLGLAAFGYSISTSYWMMAGFAVIAGIGNGVFHPVDYTLLNRKVSAPRLGHAYSVHGITGSLGWALAPAMLVPLTFAFSWRVALACAGVLAFAVLAVLVVNRDKLTLTVTAPAKGATAADSSLGFLKIPAVWMCFAFFFWYAIVLSVVQAFAPEAARQLHDVPLPLVAMCLTIYMVCSAGGMVFGGFLASNPARCERIVGIGFGVAAGSRCCWPWAATRRGWCRCCSVSWGFPRALPGRRATCWSSARRRTTPRAASMAWYTPAWTSARPCRR